MARGTGKTMVVGLSLCQETGVEETTKVISSERLLPQRVFHQHHLLAGQGRAVFPNSSPLPLQGSQTLFRKSLVPRKWRLCLLQFSVLRSPSLRILTVTPAQPAVFILLSLSKFSWNLCAGIRSHQAFLKTPPKTELSPSETLSSNYFCHMFWGVSN